MYIVNVLCDVNMFECDVCRFFLYLFVCEMRMVRLIKIRLMCFRVWWFINKIEFFYIYYIMCMYVI